MNHILGFGFQKVYFLCLLVGSFSDLNFWSDLTLNGCLNFGSFCLFHFRSV